jgi:hypothetical protein
MDLNNPAVATIVEEEVNNRISQIFNSVQFRMNCLQIAQSVKHDTATDLFKDADNVGRYIRNLPTEEDSFWL